MENYLGTKIKQILDKKKLSVFRLERMSNVQRGNISAIIMGRSKNPSIDTIRKICIALECRWSDLLGEDWILEKSPSLLSSMGDYSNIEWDNKLFEQSTEIIEKHLNKHNLSFSLNITVGLIIDLYLYSFTKNNKQIDEKVAEWLVEKLQVTMPIKSNGVS